MTDADARQAFETLQQQITDLTASGEDGQDEAHDLLQDILWWVLGAGARDDGPNDAYIVALSRSVKNSTAERTLLALSMVQGVVGVTPVGADNEIYVAESRIRSELVDLAMSRARTR